MFSVHQHWDPLQVCAVGRSYPPEFYDYIENPRVRSVLERISIETEEDYQKLIKILESFNVKIVRNDISENREDHFWAEHYSPPPMIPRDHTAMIGEKFYMPGAEFGYNVFDDMLDYEQEFSTLQSIKKLTSREKIVFHKKLQDTLEKKDIPERKRYLSKVESIIRSINHNPLTTFPNNKKFNTFGSIEKFLKDNNTEIIYDKYINNSTITRVGKDLYIGVEIDDIKTSSFKEYLRKINQYFSSGKYRIHIVDVRTHGSDVFIPIKPGLIIGLNGVENYNKTFPDWEVVYLPGQKWDKVKQFQDLKKKNKGKWWVPGEELDDDFVDFIESWLNHWVIYAEENIFDANMLIINPTNVIVNNYNKNIFDAFDRHGITAHICNFRHRYFWDGGLHCITSDLSREGIRQNYFPERNI